MTIADWVRQASAGGIVGLSSVIYAVSYGALLFSGPLAPHVGFAIAAALVTAVVGALFGLLSGERTLISGPDSNTISVIAAMLAAMGSVGLNSLASANLAMAAVLLTSVVCATVFYALARFRLAGLVRYIPFPVMAGFLASTGWLMSSGALNIISATPLTLAGLDQLLANPVRPELLFGITVACALFALSPKVSGAILIPLVMLFATGLVNVLLDSDWCSGLACSRDVWMFAGLNNVAWTAPWQLTMDWQDVRALLGVLPSMFVVSFVGLITILLSIASLELSFKKEFDLNQILQTHAFSTWFSALLGGFVGIISIGRTSLNRAAGGGIISGVIAASICLVMLLGAGDVIAYIPKAALGGLVLYLGLSMLKQWLWDQRTHTARDEFAQIVLIVVVVANYGYLIGFVAGILLASIIFVLEYSRTSLASLSTNLALLPSSVVRPSHEVDLLTKHGGKTVIYRLEGYIFFGSASKIDLVFQEMNIETLECVVIDFTNVSGIDRSAIGVFQRILRRYQNLPLQFYFVYAEANRRALEAISLNSTGQSNFSYFPSLDLAQETAEERIVRGNVKSTTLSGCFDFLDIAADRDNFLNYCESRDIVKKEMLCRDGESSDAIYFVARGGFEVIKPVAEDTYRRLAKISAGAVVGEMAFYTGDVRAASIRAVVDSQVYVLQKDSLFRMRAHSPELATQFDHMVIRKISNALARANRVITTLGNN
jgi:sulfate permease, SulP family